MIAAAPVLAMLRRLRGDQRGSMLIETAIVTPVLVLMGDCQDFRVWAGIMGKKESHYVPTQRTGDTG